MLIEGCYIGRGFQRMKKEYVICVKKHVVGRDDVKWSNVIDEDEKEYRAKNGTLGNTWPDG